MCDPAPAPERVLATVLFTDIVDSTRLATEIGDRRWRELLEEHQKLVREQLRRFEGREIKTTGDGFLAIFDGPTRARRVRAGDRRRDAVAGDRGAGRPAHRRGRADGRGRRRDRGPRRRPDRRRWPGRRRCSPRARSATSPSARASSSTPSAATPSRASPTSGTSTASRRRRSRRALSTDCAARTLLEEGSGRLVVGGAHGGSPTTPSSQSAPRSRAGDGRRSHGRRTS